jgi:acetyl esterase/lipase
MSLTRRAVLRALGVAGSGGVVALAGCTEGESTTATTSDARTSRTTATTVATGMAEPTTAEGGSGVLGAPDEETERASVYRDVPFRETEDGTLLLDVHYPRGVDGPVPLLVHVHGGGWAFGSKGGGRFARVPLSAGVAVASVGYRLSGTATYPGPVRDVVGAMGWVREHADALGVDAERVGLTGESAGGHLASLVAAAPDVPDLRPAGTPASAARASCVVSVSGVYDFTVEGEGGVGGRLVREFLGCEDEACEPQRAQASPVTHFGSSDTPALLYHGTADRVVAYEQAERYVATAEDAGVPVSLVTGDGGAHVDPYQGDWGDRYERRQRAFLREHLL